MLPTPADPNAAYLPEGGTTLTPEQQKDVVHLWLVNHWMKEIMSDTSPVSYFSRGIHSQFFGDLVTENPYLIDCLMHLPKDKLDRARVRCGWPIAPSRPLMFVMQPSSHSASATLSYAAAVVIMVKQPIRCPP